MLEMWRLGSSKWFITGGTWQFSPSKNPPHKSQLWSLSVPTCWLHPSGPVSMTTSPNPTPGVPVESYVIYVQLGGKGDSDISVRTPSPVHHLSRAWNCSKESLSPTDDT